MNQTIQDLIGNPRALFVISHSGGKDSQAQMIKLLEIVPRDQLLVVHAALGEVEWHGALEQAQQQAADAGVPFLVARAVWKDGSEKTLLNMVERRFAERPEVPSWPSGDCRQCTSDLKRDPINREVRRYIKRENDRREHVMPIDTVIVCDGIRAAESDERAKYEPFVINKRLTCIGRTAYTWLPIFEMTTAEVFATIAAAGQKPHPAYAQNERLSCVFCIYGSPNDLAHGAQQRPELYARYLELEARTGYTMHVRQKPLAELVAMAELKAAA
jgi:3'-phosphoadenosine 5'-phosphosulfate sulfotransferase (PAPS reductase)/FAD synthetase